MNVLMLKFENYITSSMIYELKHWNVKIVQNTLFTEILNIV